MKTFSILFVFLIGISQGIAADTESGDQVYDDDLTQYTVFRATAEPRTYHEIWDAAGGIAASFTLKRDLGRVFLTNFNLGEDNKSEIEFCEFSFFTILGYLEGEKYAVSGPESGFFWSDDEGNESFLAEYGFKKATEIPASLTALATSGEIIYVRGKKCDFIMKDEDENQQTIEK